MIWKHFGGAFHITKSPSNLALNMQQNGEYIHMYEINKKIVFNNITSIIPLQNINITKRENNNGVDERFNKTDNFDEIFGIEKNFKKQYLLLALLDDSISIYEKLNLLLEHTYLNDFVNSAINITAGGLFDDYDFDNF